MEVNFQIYHYWRSQCTMKEVNMKIIINNSSQQPIYDQIAEQMKAQIIKKELKEHEMLPSVRGLSKELKISALTVKKAYDCLEREGFITTVHGKGSYVASTNRELLMEEQRKEVEADMEAAVRKARSSGMKDEEIQELFQLIMEDE